MARYTPKHRERVKVKGRGGRVYRVLSSNSNSAMIEATGEDYEVTWASLNDLSKAAAPKKKAD